MQGSSQRARSGDPEAKESFVQRLLRWSILEFESPEVESGYQRFLATQRWGYMLAFAPMFALGWVQIFQCIVTDSQGGQVQIPSGFIASAVLYLLPTAALLAVMSVRPAIYAKHWRWVNVAFMMVHVFSVNGFQQLCLWQRSCTAEQSWVQVFAAENLYLTIICLRVMIFSSGLACDIFYTILGLILNFSGNGARCASPLWGPPRVTLSPPIVAVAHKSCSWLLAILSSHGVVVRCPPPAELSCPAVLGFWQVVGCGLACFLVIAREVMSRRAYLKSRAGHPGGPRCLAGASWPLSNAKTMHNLIGALLALCVAPAIIWALALSSLQEVR